MADEEDNKLVKRVSYVVVHKVAAGISLLCLLVVAVAGLSANASVFSMTWRAFIAILLVKVMSVVLIKVLATYEEMDGV
ncbi:MAG: hypothetical protein R3A13_06595 [Bdellovibrionota bacterium]